GAALSLGFLHRRRLASPGQRRPDGDGSLCAADRPPESTDRAAAGVERRAAAAGSEGLRIHQAAQRAFAGGDGSALRAVPEIRAPVLSALLGPALAAADLPGRRSCPRRDERSSPEIRAFAGPAHVLDVAVRVLRA